MNQIQKLYKELLKEYGHQGWWPLIDVNGYHHKDYSYPKNKNQIFEICVGAILTQNTSWKQVEKALINLSKLKALEPKALKELNNNKLKKAIKPTGYFNQKAKKLKIFAEFYLDLKGKTPTRIQLLEIWGIGPETADSILLYAYKQPTFIIDAYTKRIMNFKGKYDELKQLFEDNLKKDYKLYQEFHALLVEAGKSPLSSINS